MILTLTFLPATGRGTAGTVVVGASVLTQDCALGIAPSVSRFASATSPCRG